MLSSSEIRNFRYVGTLTACRVATCLVKVVATLADERETAQSQEAAEARKKGNKASTANIPLSCCKARLRYLLWGSLMRFKLGKRKPYCAG